MLHHGVERVSWVCALDVVQSSESQDVVGHGHDVLWWADVGAVEVGDGAGAFVGAAVDGFCGDRPGGFVAFGSMVSM